MAGVSQGAVSRLEGGRGLATPLLVVMKINAALRRAVSTIDPELLSDDARRSRMADAAREHGRPRAAEDIAKDLLDLAGISAKKSQDAAKKNGATNGTEFHFRLSNLAKSKGIYLGGRKSPSATWSATRRPPPGRRSSTPSAPD